MVASHRAPVSEDRERIRNAVWIALSYFSAGGIGFFIAVVVGGWLR